MAKKQSDPAAAVFKMLAFQYKPIEKALKKMATPEDWKMYQGFSAAKKIRVLDRVAYQFGL